MDNISERLLHLGEIIRSTRKELHLTQQQLAEDTHHTLRHIQRIEKGEVNLTFDMLYTICHRLGLSADTFFYPETPSVEREMAHLRVKLSTCTAEEQELIIRTMDYLATQFISRHKE